MAGGAGSQRRPRRRLVRWASWISLVAVLATIAASMINATGPLVMPLIAVAGVALVVDAILIFGSRGNFGTRHD